MQDEKGNKNTSLSISHPPSAYSYCLFVPIIFTHSSDAWSRKQHKSKLFYFKKFIRFLILVLFMMDYSCVYSDTSISQNIHYMLEDTSGPSF